MKRLFLAIGALLLFAAAPSRAQTTAHNFVFNWTASAPCTGAAVCNPTSYIVQCGVTSGGEQTIATVAAPATTYTWTGGTAGTTYFCWVVAANNVGTSGPSKEVSTTFLGGSSTPPANTAVPSNPAGLTITAN